MGRDENGRPKGNGERSGRWRGLGLLWAECARSDEGRRAWLRTVQYSSASITVRTRVVTDASAGSGDISSMSRVVVVDLPEAADIALLDETEVVLAVRVVVLVELIERADLGEDRIDAGRRIGI